jgi:flagellar basal-body rod modification protein FlgD
MTTTIAQTAASPAPTAASPASTTATAQATLGGDLNTFLKLLTTQLQNQDPTSPLDTNQFTQQLVSFSQVEQAINTNDKLTNLLALQSADQLVTALPLVGHTVQFADNQTTLANSKAEFTYNLPTQAATGTLTITDASGNIVLQAPAATDAGDHTFNWDGKGSDGSQLPDGAYTFNVSATGADKSPITAAITSFGKVDSIQTKNGATMFQVGPINETLDKVVAITNTVS